MRFIGGFVRATAVVVTLTFVGAAFVAAPVAAAGGPSGYRAISGPTAAGFAIPGDVSLVRTWLDPATGLDFERYQQYAAPLGVFVNGAQLTVVRRGTQPVLVIGNYFPDLRVTRAPALSPAQAISIASADRADSANASPGSSSPLTYRTELRIDPVSGSPVLSGCRIGAGDARLSRHRRRHGRRASVLERH